MNYIARTTAISRDQVEVDCHHQNNHHHCHDYDSDGGDDHDDDDFDDVSTAIIRKEVEMKLTSSSS